MLLKKDINITPFHSSLIVCLVAGWGNTYTSLIVCLVGGWGIKYLGIQMFYLCILYCVHFDVVYVCHLYSLIVFKCFILIVVVLFLSKFVFSDLFSVF